MAHLVIFSPLRLLEFIKIQFRASKWVKIADFVFLEFQKLISRKIWVIEKSSNFHTVVQLSLNSEISFFLELMICQDWFHVKSEWQEICWTLIQKYQKAPNDFTWNRFLARAQFAQFLAWFSVFVYIKASFRPFERARFQNLITKSDQCQKNFVKTTRKCMSEKW